MELNRLRFVEASRSLDIRELLEVLPHLDSADLRWFRECLLQDELGDLDPTHILCAGDSASQFLNLPGHASSLYDTALEFMVRHQESIAKDTNCAAASLNLVDLLMKSGLREAAEAAARRAARMPVKRPEQDYQLAVWLLFEFGSAKAAYPLFQRAKAAGLACLATATGVAIGDLEEMDCLLSVALGHR